MTPLFPPSNVDDELVKALNETAQHEIWESFFDNSSGQRLSESRQPYFSVLVETMVVQPPAANVSVMSKPDDGRAFLLSASDSESLGWQLRVRAAAGLAGCLG